MKKTKREYFHYTKGQWRSWAKAWRNSFRRGTFAHHCDVHACDRLINQHLMTLLEILKPLQGQRPLSMAIYLPMGDEIDITPTLEYLLETGHALYAPRIVSLRHLAWHRIQALPTEVPTPLGWCKNHYGIWEPTSTQPLMTTPPDVVLVPCLMMDTQGFRLGYGGGYYDVQLESWHRQAPSTFPLTLGVVYDALCVRQLPSEIQDYPLHLRVTEFGFSQGAEAVLDTRMMLHQNLMECNHLVEVPSEISASYRN